MVNRCLDVVLLLRLVEGTYIIELSFELFGKIITKIMGRIIERFIRSIQLFRSLTKIFSFFFFFVINTI